jgi:hypothetical protein
MQNWRGGTTRTRDHRARRAMRGGQTARVPTNSSTRLDEPSDCLGRVRRESYTTYRGNLVLDEAVEMSSGRRTVIVV